MLRAGLERREVMMHPFVIGELLLGGLGNRPEILRDLRSLPAAPVATTSEVELLIGRAWPVLRGIGYVDAALLSAVRLCDGARLWTKDRRLSLAAQEMSVSYSSPAD